MSKEYEVSIPIAGIMRMIIVAENERDAKELAENAAWRISSNAVELIDEPNILEAYVDEVDAYRHITRGNVCYAPLNSIEVDCISDEDEDDEGE